MAKSVIRRAMALARQWLRKEPTLTVPLNEQNFSYPWLNSVYLRLLNLPGEKLRETYVWGILQAAFLSKMIGVDRISAIEFGVAGGQGLISLDRTAQLVGEIFGVHIEVYGFDTGKGLPKITDYRDMPNLYVAGDYPMDFERLKTKLKGAKLILGEVKDTLADFISSQPGRVGFVSQDFDLYSSTRDALKLFEASHSILMPRIYCYFDDIMGASCSEFTGERLAITEFNSKNDLRKIAPIYGLKYFLPKRQSQRMWSEMYFLAHVFDHPLYGENDGWVLSRRRDI